MVTKHGFGDLELGQTVNLIAGADGKDMALSARVMSASKDALALQLLVLPFSSEVLAQDTQVCVVRHDGRSDRAKVIRLKLESTAVVMLQPLWSPDELPNQRADRRVPARAMHAHLTSTNCRRAVRVRVRVIDLSGGGARLVSPRQFNCNEVVDLHLPLLEAASNVSVPARVIWARDLGQQWTIGVQFSGITKPAADMIKRTVFLLRWNKEV